MTTDTANRFIALLVTAYKSAGMSNVMPLLSFFGIPAINFSRAGTDEMAEDAIAAAYWAVGIRFPVFHTCKEAAVYARGINLPEITRLLLSGHYTVESLPTATLNAVADILEKALSVAVDNERRLDGLGMPKLDNPIPNTLYTK